MDYLFQLVSQKKETCPTCDGTGEVKDGGEPDDDKLIPCPDCQKEDDGWRSVEQAEDDEQVMKKK